MGALINPIRHTLNRTNSENELRCPMKCPCIWFFCSSGGNRTCESSHDEHTICLRLWLSAPEIVPFRCETDVGISRMHTVDTDIGKRIYVRQQGNIIGLAIFIAQCFRIFASVFKYQHI